jgi:hypothetical protein
LALLPVGHLNAEERETTLDAPDWQKQQQTAHGSNNQEHFWSSSRALGRQSRLGHRRTDQLYAHDVLVGHARNNFVAATPSRTSINSANECI